MKARLDRDLGTLASGLSPIIYLHPCLYKHCLILGK